LSGLDAVVKAAKESDRHGWAGRLDLSAREDYNHEGSASVPLCFFPADSNGNLTRPTGKFNGDQPGGSPWPY
jgi:hypothetical protein